MLKQLILLVFLVGVSSTASTFQPIHASSRCRSVMKNHGLTGRFPGAVAHGIHSITLEDVRYYFKSTATETNKIPTLNYDLKDEKTVLPNAPLYGFDTSFVTVAMRYVDQVLRDMDRNDYYLTGYNTLEKLVHTLHMAEVWAKAKVHYQMMVSNPPRNQKILCSCVNDINRNGIMKMLPFMSLKIRYPGITSGTTLKLPGGGRADWSGNLYNYSFFNEWSKELSKFDFNQDTKVLLEKATGKLIDGDKGMKHLDSEEMWNVWKEGMKSMNKHDDYELATFLYCALNE